MKRGFPRPQLKVSRMQNFRFSEEEQGRYGNRQYPIPYTAMDGDLSRVDPARVVECAQYKKCIVCGKHVEGDIVWVYRNGSNGWVPDSGPFHKKCKDLTIAMCPMVRRSYETENGESYQWREESWKAVGPLIRGATMP